MCGGAAPQACPGRKGRVPSSARRVTKARSTSARSKPSLSQTSAALSLIAPSTRKRISSPSTKAPSLAMGNPALYEGCASTPIVLTEIRCDRQRLIASNCALFKDRVRPTADIRCPKFVAAELPLASRCGARSRPLRQDSLAFRPKADTCTGPDSLNRIPIANACKCKITRAKSQVCPALRQVRGVWSDTTRIPCRRPAASR